MGTTRAAGLRIQLGRTTIALTTSEQHLRKLIADGYQSLYADGLCIGTSGNVAVRFENGLLITPSGLPQNEVTPESMVFVSFADVPPPTKPHKPSSEWRFHRDLLIARPEVNAVVHTHSPHATALAINHEAIPAVHYMIAAFGGNSVRCAPYARYGTQALSDAVVDALQDRKACLLANHGAITIGEDLTTAVALAHELELLAQQYILALHAGTPKLLSTEQVEEVQTAFKEYRGA